MQFAAALQGHSLGVESSGRCAESLGQGKRMGEGEDLPHPSCSSNTLPVITDLLEMLLGLNLCGR